MGVSAGIGLVVIGGAAAEQQRKSQSQARSEQRKAAAIQQEAQETSAVAEASQRREQLLTQQRQSIREERIKRARILQSAETTGVTGASGVQGAVSGLRTQGAGNQSLFAGAEAASGVITEARQFGATAQGFLNRAANFRGRAATFGAISNISIGAATSLFSAASFGEE